MNQDTKHYISISWNSHYCGSYDIISTFIYTFCAVVFLFFAITVTNNCLCQFIKEAQLSPICEKLWTIPPLPWLLVIFRFHARLGTGSSYTHAMLIFKSQMFVFIHFTNLVAQNSAKQRMTKIPSTKIP